MAAKKAKKAIKAAMVFRADVVPGMPWERWPIVRPRASERVLKWLNKYRGGVVRCRYELVSRPK